MYLLDRVRYLFLLIIILRFELIFLKNMRNPINNKNKNMFFFRFNSSYELWTD